MEDTVRQRIKDILAYSSSNVNILSKAIGIPQNTLNRQVNGDTTIPIDTILSIIGLYDSISPEWLLLGKGDMLKSNAVSAVQDTNGIPLYRIEAAAGFGNSNFSIEDTDIEARYKIKELETSSFMLHVRGDSMTPTYNNGDIVAVQVVTDYRKIQWGKPHLISSTGDGMLIKRIYDDEGDIVAVSDNPTYKPIHITKDEISGVAIVKGCVKFEN